MAERTGKSVTCGDIIYEFATEEVERAANLHYAYQFGQDSIKAYAEKSAAEGLEIANEFRQKFGDDAEAQAEFDRGVEYEKRRHGLD